MWPNGLSVQLSISLQSASKRSEMKLCTYRCWFSRPADQICPLYWELAAENSEIMHGVSFAAKIAGPPFATASPVA